MISAVLFSVSWLSQWILFALVVWLVGRWMKSPKASFWRSMSIVVVTFVYSIIGMVMMSWVQEKLPPNELMLAVLFAGLILLGVFFFSTLFIKYVFQLKTLRSIGVLVGYLVVCALSLLGVLYVLHPYVMKAYLVSSNSMAPTLVAEHRVAACPQCAQTVFLPAGGRAFVEERGICSHCLAVSHIETTKIYADIIQPDRIFVNKVLQPRRWDLVTFRDVHDPERLLVMRLVAMPGEEVQIKEGGIWINGSRLTPPVDIAAIKYVSDATLRNPGDGKKTHLQANECFVLGDFSEHSFDSRSFGPVPMANIVGVVDLIYWPWNRIRLLR